VPFLNEQRISLRYRPSLTDNEYTMLASDTPVARKASVLVASATRVARRRSEGELRLVHRLRLLNAVPGLDPPTQLDVYDLDDALFLGSASPINRRFAWAKQEARRCVACMRRARLVTAGNAFLADAARQFGKRVEVVPTCVDPARQPQRVHEPAEIVTVGWIGSRTTSPYLAPIVPALAALAQRIRFVVVGGDTGLREPWIEHRPWSLAREPHDLAGFDIGIMPQPDTEWAKGKCGYKLLQYFAAGIPAVASPVGVATKLVGSERGLLASTVDGWRSALEELISDAEERRQRGAAARAFAERHYSYQRWAPELADLMWSLG
jgi:glycosyltransferase involved in cell wall biosynthesis